MDIFDQLYIICPGWITVFFHVRMANRNQAVNMSGKITPTSRGGISPGWEKIDINEEKGQLEQNWSEKWKTFGPGHEDIFDEGN